MKEWKKRSVLHLNEQKRTWHICKESAVQNFESCHYEGFDNSLRNLVHLCLISIQNPHRGSWTRSQFLNEWLENKPQNFFGTSIAVITMFRVKMDIKDTKTSCEGIINWTTMECLLLKSSFVLVTIQKISSAFNSSFALQAAKGLNVWQVALDITLFLGYQE